MATATTASHRVHEPEMVGRTVVIIGGSAGIGLETARLARGAGAEVILTARTPARLEQAAREVGALSTGVDAIHRPDRSELISLSNVWSPQGGGAKAQVTWTMSAEAVDDQRSKYTNSLTISLTKSFMRLLRETGTRLEASDANEHNRRETARFAEGVARYSLGKAGGRPRSES